MIPGIPLSDQVLGMASLVVAVGSSIPYFTSILRGQTRPHVFTWINWGLVQAVVFVAQGAGDAGPGRWATGVGASTCLLITLLGLFYGEKHITRGDWITFLLAMATVPVWYLTRDPLYAVLLATFIDGLGYYPTYRKSWRKPWEENLLSYLLFTLAWAMSLAALETYSWTTVTYAAFSSLANIGLITLLAVRRRAMRSHPL